MNQNQSFSPQRRKEREEKQKKQPAKNPNGTEPAFVASIGDPGFERHEPFFHVVQVYFAFFASLR
jgi:hypothetical protein